MNKLFMYLLFVIFVNPIFSQVLSVNRVNVETNSSSKNDYLSKLKKTFLEEKENDLSLLEINTDKYENLLFELKANHLTNSYKLEETIAKIKGLESKKDVVIDNQTKKEINQLKLRKKQYEERNLLYIKLIYDAENLSVNFNNNAYREHQKKHYLDKKNEINKKLIETIDFTIAEVLKDELKDVEEEENEFGINYDNYIKNKLTKVRWLPSYHKFFRAYFFETHYNKKDDKTGFLNSLSFFKNDSIKTINTELVDDILGFGRLSFNSTVIVDSKDGDGDEKKEKNIEKLINGGGNFYLDYSIPIYTNYSRNIIGFYAFTNIKLATDLKGFDNNIENTTANGSLGLNFLLNLSSNLNKFNFTLASSSNIHYGTNDFFQNLNIDSHLFFNTNIIATITIDSKYRIALRTNFASEPNIRTERIVFGLQLLN